jgi:uncharacterized protein (DUF924 family)
VPASARRPAGAVLAAGAARLGILAWTVGAALPAWAQGEEKERSLLEELRGRLHDLPVLFADPTVQKYAAYVAGTVALVWLLTRIPRLLDRGGGAVLAAPSKSENLREARRAARRGDHLQAGRFFEAAEDWEAAAEAYERGRFFTDAGAAWSG